MTPEERTHIETELAASADASREWIVQQQMDAALRAVLDGERARVVRSIMEVVTGPSLEAVKLQVLREVKPGRWPMAAALTALAAAAAVSLAPLLKREVFMPGIIKPPVATKDSKLGLSKQPGKRQAFMWPFAAESPWNQALGIASQYEPIRAPGFNPRTPLASATLGRPVFNEVENFPMHRVLVNERPVHNVRFADRWQQGFAAEWPVIVIVDPAHMMVAELRGADRLPSGDLVAQEIHTSRLDGDGLSGLAESGVSALGGLIRYGELARGISHALAVSVRRESLGGNLRLGTRLALPASFEVGGSELARALRDYGAFVTDAGAEPFAFFTWYENVPPDFAQQVAALLPHLQVVTRSAGAPRRPPAPPFDR